MSELRVILLIVGVAIIAAIYFFSRSGNRTPQKSASAVATNNPGELDDELLDDLADGTTSSYIEDDFDDVPPMPNEGIPSEGRVEPDLGLDQLDVPEPTLGGGFGNNSSALELDDFPPPGDDPLYPADETDTFATDSNDAFDEPLLDSSMRERLAERDADSLLDSASSDRQSESRDDFDDAFDDDLDQDLDHDLGALAEPVHFRHSLDDGADEERSRTSRKSPRMTAAEATRDMFDSDQSIPAEDDAKTTTPSASRNEGRRAANVDDLDLDIDSTPPLFAEDDTANATDHPQEDAWDDVPDADSESRWNQSRSSQHVDEVEAEDTASSNTSTQSQQSRVDEVPAEEQKPLILYLAARETLVPGAELAKLLADNNMRLDDRGLYERRQSHGGAVLFHLANMHQPGIFSANTIQTDEFSGLALFAILPAQIDSLVLFDELLATARMLADHFGCQILDESRSVFSSQTEQFMREEIIRYEHQRKAKA